MINVQEMGLNNHSNKEGLLKAQTQTFRKKKILMKIIIYVIKDQGKKIVTAQSQ